MPPPAQQTEGQAGVEQLKKPPQQTEGRAEVAPKPEEGGQSTTGQKPPETGTQTEGTAETKQPAPDEDTAETQGKPSSETTGSINVTAEQKTEIKQIITETKVEPVRDVDIDISVGATVPKTIEVHPLPSRIVELVPDYEGYMYFVLADGRIVIVEPDTFEIVVILA